SRDWSSGVLYSDLTGLFGNGVRGSSPTGGHLAVARTGDRNGAVPPEGERPSGALGDPRGPSGTVRDSGPVRHASRRRLASGPSPSTATRPARTPSARGSSPRPTAVQVSVSSDRTASGSWPAGPSP